MRVDTSDRLAYHIHDATIPNEFNFNLLELESGEEGTAQLEKIRFYTVVSLEGNEINENEVKLFDQDGGEIIGTSLSSIEKMNKRPDSSGDLVFVPVITFEVSGDAEYIFHNQGNNTLWVLDDIKIQSSLISDEIILISMISCCLGFPLGIIALIGWFVVWRKKDKKSQKIIIKEDINLILLFFLMMSFEKILT